MIVPNKPGSARTSAAASAARAGAAGKSLIGFLTVVDQPDAGFCGGYLILNSAARPVEFHCSAPLKSNRAQEILYGATLQPYLCGELIAGTLLAKAKNRPALVCTDCTSAMPAREGISMPMVLVLGEEPNSSTNSPDEAELQAFEFGDQELAVSGEFLADRSAACAMLQTLGERFDLCEPFERIRLAMEEAQRSAHR